MKIYSLWRMDMPSKQLQRIISMTRLLFTTFRSALGFRLIRADNSSIIQESTCLQMDVNSFYRLVIAFKRLNDQRIKDTWLKTRRRHSNWILLVIMRFLGLAISLISLPLCIAQTTKVEIFAETYFNPTGYQVQSGKKYQLTASGIWTDWSEHASPYLSSYCSCCSAVQVYWQRRQRLPIHLVAPTFREFPQVTLARLVRVSSTLRTTHFEECLNCFRFRLICCVNESEDNCMSIGTKATIAPIVTGQLFCYANDVPNMYWNNKGKLDLQISAL